MVNFQLISPKWLFLGIKMTYFHKIQNKLKNLTRFHLDYTGERVVPTEMSGDTRTWIRHLSRYVFAINYVINKKVLDVACGTGYGSALLSTVAKQVTGVDKNKETLKWAEKNNKFYCSVKFTTQDLEKENISATYDTIVCFETIEHLSNPGNFLRMLKKATKKNGQIVFSVPLNDPPNKFHKHRFNLETITSLVKKNLGSNLEWFSQFDQNILRGRDKKALFAIGIWVNNEK